MVSGHLAWTARTPELTPKPYRPPRDHQTSEDRESRIYVQGRIGCRASAHREAVRPLRRDFDRWRRSGRSSPPPPERQILIRRRSPRPDPVGVVQGGVPEREAGHGRVVRDRMDPDELHLLMSAPIAHLRSCSRDLRDGDAASSLMATPSPASTRADGARRSSLDADRQLRFKDMQTDLPWRAPILEP